MNTNIAELIFGGDGEKAILAILQDGQSHNFVDENGTPATMLAILSGENGILRLLLNSRSSANAKDSENETALHLGAALHNLEAIKLLLDHGAEIDSRNAEGRTPLMVASIMGNLKACQALVDSGASPNAVDLQGRGMLHWAALRNDDADLIDFLIAAGADPWLVDMDGATPCSLAGVVGHNNALKSLSIAVNGGAA